MTTCTGLRFFGRPFLPSELDRDAFDISSEQPRKRVDLVLCPWVGWTRLQRPSRKRSLTMRVEPSRRRVTN